MNKLKNDRSVLQAPNSWKGSLFLWEDRNLYLGAALDTTLHARHQATIIVAMRDTFRLRTSTGWRSLRAAIIPPDLPTIFEARGDPIISLDFFPELMKTNHSLFPGVLPYAVPSKILSRFLPSLTKYLNNGCASGEATELTEDLISELALAGAPRFVLDSRVARSLEIFQSDPTHQFTAAEISSEVSLSPSRFAHLFRQQIGMPVRRYLLELRSKKALLQFAQGDSLTTSAFEAGFADSAHLSRTFRRLTGFAPSSLLKNTRVVPCKE